MKSTWQTPGRANSKVDQPNQLVVEWWWELLEEFSQEKRAQVLQFATGAGSLPVGGFPSLSRSGGLFRVSTGKVVADGENQLPKSATCFNHMSLPKYASKEQLETCLNMALEYSGQGFGNASRYYHGTLWLP